MRSEFLQLAFYLIALVVGGAAEEVLPKCLAVGFPVLLALAVGVAARRSFASAVLLALAAGGFEDALSSLPMMMSPCFFLVAALIAWRTRLAKTVLIVAYPAYQVWLKLMVPGIAGSFGARVGLAIPIAFLVAFVLLPVCAWLERKAAVDGAA